jgi:hypothetical protein
MAIAAFSYEILRGSKSLILNDLDPLSILVFLSDLIILATPFLEKKHGGIS